MMENCKSGARKMGNKTTLMEGLISFYNEGNIREDI